MTEPYVAALRIGGFTFQVRSRFQITFDIGYSSFISNNAGKPDLFLQVDELSGNYIENSVFIFEAVEQGIPLWRVSKNENGYRLFLYNQLRKDEIQSVIDIPHNTNNWQVYCRLENGCAEPLLYPAGPLLLYMFAIRNKAFMQHASAVVSNGKAFVFSGFSGIGKSTMAAIWGKKGYTVINDDRILIRQNSEGFMAYNTPMFYPDKPKQAPLSAVFLLKQHSWNYIKQLSGVAAITNFMRFSIQHAYDKQFLEAHLNLAHEVYKAVPVFELGFKPDAAIIDFIHLHT